MSAKRGLGYQTMLSVVLGPDNAARAAFMVGTGCEWSASEVALRDDVRKDFVRVRGTKAETRDRDVPLVRVWQRELVDYALEHGMGKDGLLFRPNTSFTHALYRRPGYFLEPRRSCSRGLSS